jgi:preprotein translocase subunit SecG
MFAFLIIIFVISAILLVLIVMVQDDKGEGIGGLFAGGGGSTFGSRSGNVLTRVTTVLAAIFLVSALAAAWINRSVSSEELESRARIRALEEQQDDWYVRTPEEPSAPAADDEAEEQGQQEQIPEVDSASEAE